MHYSIKDVAHLEAWYKKQIFPESWTMTIGEVEFNQNSLKETLGQLIVSVETQDSSSEYADKYSALLELKYTYGLEGADRVWAVSWGGNDESTPVAAFSERRNAELMVQRLNQYVEGGGRVDAVAADLIAIAVDRFASHVELGLSPFCVEMMSNGSLFDMMDLLADDLEEPTIFSIYRKLNENKPDGKFLKEDCAVVGTFWALDSELAFKKANLLRKELIRLIGLSKRQVVRQLSLENLDVETMLTNAQLSFLTNP